MTAHSRWKAAALAGLLASAHAVPSVNVAVRTAFGAPPYLIELLYVPTYRPTHLSLLRKDVEKPQQKRTRHRTSLSSTESPTGTLIPPRRIKSYISPSEQPYLKMDTWTRRASLPSITPFRSTRPLLESKHITNTTIIRLCLQVRAMS